MRDYQISKVYDAEGDAFPHFNDTMTIMEAESVCDTMLESRCVKNLIKTLTCCTHPSKGFRVSGGDKRFKHAQANNTFMCLPKGTRNISTICHELAHTLTIDNTNDPSYAYHGKEFCHVYLELVKQFMGVGDYNNLKKEFMKKGVGFSIE